MPGKIKVKVLAGRNLPVMDRAGDTTDAFVEIKFGCVTHKTDVCRKSLNPHWNSTEWYRFEVDESELQDEPLQLRLMDHDTYSANDAIGKVVISLAPLLAREAIQSKTTGGAHNAAVLSGWIPVFDTLHGIRGELNIIVKVELFSDFNKYKTSSCGVQFFHCPTIPPGYRVTSIHGFVEELVVNDDPEYQWIDKIRTPRASNEARQVAFIKLGNQVQRLVGLKAAELGANAVVGYQQDFDLEGEAGVVARATGTAVSISLLPTQIQPNIMPPCTQQNDRVERDKTSPCHTRHESCSQEPVHTKSNISDKSNPLSIHRRSSDSDINKASKASAANVASGNANSSGGAILRPSMNTNNLDMLEYPFLTMMEYPPKFIVHIGGTVCARSVKLSDGGGEGVARAAWWAELRTELRSHARALRCNAVLAYKETVAICEDVCVLSVSGTAAVINLDSNFNADIEGSVTAGASKQGGDEGGGAWCSVAHVPYSPAGMPYRAELSSCGVCRRARVPKVLLATCSKPKRLLAYPTAVTVTAVAGRMRRAAPTAEPGARDISDQVPFLEYEMHKLLLAKLRMQGANALFELRTQVAVGERCVVALLSGTAYRLACLPPPQPPSVKVIGDSKEALEIQKALRDTFAANRAANGYDVVLPESNSMCALAEHESEMEDLELLDLNGDKDACILELDETEDVEIARSLAEREPGGGAPAWSEGARCLPRAAPNAFLQVSRVKLSGAGPSGFGGVGGAAGVAGRAGWAAQRALQAAAHKLRALRPLALAAPTFHLDLTDEEIQVVLSGTAIRLQPAQQQEPARSAEDVAVADEDAGRQDAADDKAQAGGAVPLTSLRSVCGARRVRQLCALRLLFVRETTTVRELGGLSGFVHTFTCEVLAIVRAYTAALGGNCLTSFYITQLMLQHNAHKNQGQCLLSVGGDVVFITY